MEDKEEVKEEKVERGDKKQNIADEKKMNTCDLDKYLEIYVDQEEGENTIDEKERKVKSRRMKRCTKQKKEKKEKDIKVKWKVEKYEEEMEGMDEEGVGNFKNEEYKWSMMEPKEAKRKGVGMRGRKDEGEEDKRKEGFLEREREEEEVVVVSRVKEMMGAIVWEYAEWEHGPPEWEETTEEGQSVSSPYTWDMRSKDAFSKMRSIGVGEHCMTNQEIRRRSGGEDECLEAWWADDASYQDASYQDASYQDALYPDASYQDASYQESNLDCYLFSDNTCVVCTRVVFTGQCIFHK